MAKTKHLNTMNVFGKEVGMDKKSKIDAAKKFARGILDITGGDKELEKITDENGVSHHEYIGKDSDYSVSYQGKVIYNMIAIEAQVSGMSNEDACKMATDVTEYWQSYEDFTRSLENDETQTGAEMSDEDLERFDKQYFDAHPDLNREDVLLWTAAGHHAYCKNTQGAELNDKDPIYELASGTMNLNEYIEATGNDSIDLNGVYFMPDDYMADVWSQETLDDQRAWWSGIDNSKPFDNSFADKVAQMGIIGAAVTYAKDVFDKWKDTHHDIFDKAVNMIESKTGKSFDREAAADELVSGIQKSGNDMTYNYE